MRNLRRDDWRCEFNSVPVGLRRNRSGSSSSRMMSLIAASNCRSLTCVSVGGARSQVFLGHRADARPSRRFSRTADLDYWCSPIESASLITARPPSVSKRFQNRLTLLNLKHDLIDISPRPCGCGSSDLYGRKNLRRSPALARESQAGEDW